MLFGIATLLIKIFGFDFDKAIRVARFVLVGVALLIVLIVAGLVFRSCGSRKVKLDEKSIQAAQTAIATRDEVKMREVIANSDAKEAEATATAANASAVAVNAIAESKKRWANANVHELTAELEARK